MTFAPQSLLVGAVVGVGILHTIVPDHWVPIALVARQQGWSRRETAQAALRAGAGHVVSTLLIGLAVWVAGAAIATKFGTIVSMVSSLALIAFGGWIGLSSLRELRYHGGHSHDREHDNEREHEYDPGYASVDEHGHLHEHDAVPNGTHVGVHPQSEPDDSHGDGTQSRPYESSRGDVAVRARHAHLHRHGQGSPHVHLHDHDSATLHALPSEGEIEPLLHEHAHATSSRTALLLILGSSPMVEGIPAFLPPVSMVSDSSP